LLPPGPQLGGVQPDRHASGASIGRLVAVPQRRLLRARAATAAPTSVESYEPLVMVDHGGDAAERMSARSAG